MYLGDKPSAVSGYRYTYRSGRWRILKHFSCVLLVFSVIWTCVMRFSTRGIVGNKYLWIFNETMTSSGALTEFKTGPLYFFDQVG